MLGAISAVFMIIEGIISIPTTVLMILGVAGLATRLGQRKAMLIGSWGGIITNGALIVLWLFGDYKSMDNGNGGLSISLFTILYIVLNIARGWFHRSFRKHRYSDDS